MRRSIILLALSLAASCGPEHVDHETDGSTFTEATAAPIRCVLTSRKERYATGDKLELSVQLHNDTAHQLALVPCLDGSESGFRLPHCSVSLSRDGLPVARRSGGRSGNTDDISPLNIVTLEPGASFEPFGPGGHFDRWLGGFSLAEPGEYRIRFHDSTASDDDSAFRGGPLLGPDDPTWLKELTSRLALVPRISVSSNELVLQVE